MNTNFKWSHTKRIVNELKNKLEFPYGNSMICAIRVSKNIMNCIEKHASQ